MFIHGVRFIVLQGIADAKRGQGSENETFR